MKWSRKFALDKGYRNWWKETLNDPNLSRLAFYKKIKTDFRRESYVESADFIHRRYISKLRCSNHSLEIEKGRHKKKLREERICVLCKSGVVEDEEHFLLTCDKYATLKVKHKLEDVKEITDFFSEENSKPLRMYLVEAFKMRGKSLEITTME